MHISTNFMDNLYVPVNDIERDLIYNINFVE